MCKPIVYAAGPITGRSFDSATGWYPLLRTRLPECDIVVPMRGKDWAIREQVESFKSGDYAEDYRLSGLEASISSDNGIFARDMWDVGRADLVFANLLDADRVSIGTVAEIVAAKLGGNLAVVVREKGGLHDHAFLRQAAWATVTNFDDGVAAARIALNLV